MQTQTPRLREVHSHALARSTHALPLCTSITGLGECETPCHPGEEPPASSYPPAIMLRSPGQAGTRMAWLLLWCSRWLFLPTVLWLHRPGLWSGSEATLGSLDLELRSTAFPVQLARHLPVSNHHLRSTWTSAPVSGGFLNKYKQPYC